MKKCGGFLAFLMFKAQEVADFFGGKDEQLFRYKTGVTFIDKLVY